MEVKTKIQLLIQFVLWRNLKIFPYQGWCHVSRYVLDLDLLLSVHEDGKRNSLSLLVYPVHNLHFDLGFVRIQANCWNWKVSLRAEIVNMKRLKFCPGPFHPGEVVCHEVVVVFLRHSTHQYRCRSLLSPCVPCSPVI